MAHVRGACIERSHVRTVRVEDGIKQPPDIFKYHSLGANLVDKMDCLGEKVALVLGPELLPGLGEVRGALTLLLTNPRLSGRSRRTAEGPPYGHETSVIKRRLEQRPAVPRLGL